MMATERVDDIHAFRIFLDEQLANGGVCLTPARPRPLGDSKAVSVGLASINRGSAPPYTTFSSRLLADQGRTHGAEKLAR